MVTEKVTKPSLKIILSHYKSWPQTNPCEPLQGDIGHHKSELVLATEEAISAATKVILPTEYHSRFENYLSHRKSDLGH